MTEHATAATPGKVHKTKRRHPAEGARIAAVGLGATTMLGLVGYMGYSAQPAVPGTSAHPVPLVASTDQGTIALTAHPTVRQATPQADANVASTHGSR